jgi:hypothetical protein
MERIQVFIFDSVKWNTAASFTNCCIRTQGRGAFAAIQPFVIPAYLEEVFIVPKLAAAHDTMKFFQRPVYFSIGWVSSITQTNRKEIGIILMNQLDDDGAGESGEQFDCRQRSSIFCWRRQFGDLASEVREGGGTAAMAKELN